MKQRRYIGYKNSQLGYFEFLTLRVQLVVANSGERVYFEQQILTLLLVHPTPNLSRIKFARISPQVKSLRISWGLPREAFHVATKPALKLDRKITGATNGYNVAVANNILRYNLRLKWRKTQTNKLVLISNADRIASHPRKNVTEGHSKSVL